MQLSTSSIGSPATTRFGLDPDQSCSSTLHLTGVKCIPNRAAALVRLFIIIGICGRSDPRKAMSTAYSMSVRQHPGSSSTPQETETGREDYKIKSIAKLKTKVKEGQPCLTPVDMKN